MKKLLLIFSLLCLWMGSSSVWAQQPNYYPNPPKLSCSKTAIGSEMEIRLSNAPPNADVRYSFQEVKKGGPISFENQYPPKEGFNYNDSLPPFKTDFQGRHVWSLHLPIQYRELVGHVFCVDVLVNLEIRIQQNFILENPSLHVTTYGPGNRSMISRYDEIEETLSSEFELEGRKPIKALFGRDLNKAYFMLDDNRILVLDYPKKEIVFEKRVFSPGLTDMIITPDSRRLIALTVDKNFGELWVYDTKNMRLLDRVKVGLVSKHGSKDFLAVTRDSTMVFVRQSGLMVGEYNLINGGFQRKRLGTNEHSGGKVFDLKVCHNRMTALISLPNGFSCLTVVNIQNYKESFINLARDPKEIQIFCARDLYILFTDALYRVNLESLETDSLSLPNGAHSFAITKLSDIGMILYPDKTAQSLVRFFKLSDFILLSKEVRLDAHGDAHKVLLSQSPLMKSGYVLSPESLVRIDLEKLESSGSTPLPGDPRDCKEIY